MPRKRLFTIAITVTTLLLLLVTGCHDERRNVAVINGTVHIGQIQCDPGGQPIQRLERCGLNADERQRAMKLLLAEKQAKIRQQKRKISRLRPTEEELLWMARTFYGEAENEYGMTLIGNVVLERAEESCWPDTIREVINEDWAFTAIHRGERGVLQLTLGDYDNKNLPRPTLNKWRRSVRAAYGVLTLPDSLRPPEAHGYANLREAEWQPWMSSWARTYTQGAHTYYRRPGDCGASHNLANR